MPFHREKHDREGVTLIFEDILFADGITLGHFVIKVLFDCHIYIIPHCVNVVRVYRAQVQPYKANSCRAF